MGLAQVMEFLIWSFFLNVLWFYSNVILVQGTLHFVSHLGIAVHMRYLSVTAAYIGKCEIYKFSLVP